MKRCGRIAGMLGVLATSLCLPPILLSQETSGSPKPAAREYPPVGDLSNAQNQSDSQPLTPDEQPLTGVQTATLGTPEMRHSYWVPGFGFGNFIQSSSILNPAVPSWNSTSYLSGNLNLLQAWRHALLNVSYSGGGFFSTDSAMGNGYFQQFGLAQEFDWQRWQLSFIDQFAYLPQSQFGFGAGTNLSLPGIGGSLGAPPVGLQGGYVPNQSIYSAIGPRVSNAFVTQIGYRVTPRSTLTFAGSYGLLHFTQSGNVDSNDVIGSAGYNYQLSKFSTVGVVYRFSAYHYVGQPQSIGDHTIQLAYGRKITGRLALQLYGGPDITHFRVPIGTLTKRISGAGAANLRYAIDARTNLSAGYTHGVSGGSGVFAGAISDQFQGGIDRQLSRQWHGGIHIGYSRNSAISQNGSQASPLYDTWYTGVSLQRQLGEDAHLSLSYTAFIESSNQAIPTITTPSTDYTQHQLAIEFGWHTRPFVIR